MHPEDELLSLLESQLPEPVPKPVDGGRVRPPLQHDAHAMDAGLLRLQGERRHGDEDKSRRNLEKHGVALAQAVRGFQRPMLVRRDERQNYGEARWIALGDLGGTAVVVVYARRGERIRLISGRRANKRERKVYEARTREAK